MTTILAGALGGIIIFIIFILLIWLWSGRKEGTS